MLTVSLFHFNLFMFWQCYVLGCIRYNCVYVLRSDWPPVCFVELLATHYPIRLLSTALHRTVHSAPMCSCSLCSLHLHSITFKSSFTFVPFYVRHSNWLNMHMHARVASLWMQSFLISWLCFHCNALRAVYHFSFRGCCYRPSFCFFLFYIFVWFSLRTVTTYNGGKHNYSAHSKLVSPHFQTYSSRSSKFEVGIFKQDLRPKNWGW